MRRRRPEVRPPCRPAHLRGQTLETAAADLLDAPPVGCAGGLLVQVDGEVEPPRDFLAHLGRQCGALGHAAGGQGDEGDDVDGPDAGMDAGMRAEVDAVEGGGAERENGLLQGGGGAHQRQDGPVVRRVRRRVEQGRAGCAGDGRDQRVDHVGAASFADVGNRFDQVHAAGIARSAGRPAAGDADW